MNQLIDIGKSVIKVMFASVFVFWLGSQFLVECRYNMAEKIKEAFPDEFGVTPKNDIEPAKYFIDGKEVSDEEHQKWFDKNWNKIGKGKMVSEDLKVNSKTSDKRKRGLR